MVENNSRKTNKTFGKTNGVDANQDETTVLDSKTSGFIRASVIERKSRNKQKLYKHLLVQRDVNGKTWDGGFFASDLIALAEVTRWAAKWMLERGEPDHELELKLTILLDALEGIAGVNNAFEECLMLNRKRALEDYKELKKRS